MSDIVGWLRATAIIRDRDVAYKYREAAAEIERLRAALKGIMDCFDNGPWPPPLEVWDEAHNALDQ